MCNHKGVFLFFSIYFFFLSVFLLPLLLLLLSFLILPPQSIFFRPFRLHLLLKFNPNILIQKHKAVILTRFPSLLLRPRSTKECMQVAVLRYEGAPDTEPTENVEYNPNPSGTVCILLF